MLLRTRLRLESASGHERQSNRTRLLKHEHCERARSHADRRVVSHAIALPPTVRACARARAHCSALLLSFALFRREWPRSSHRQLHIQVKGARASRKKADETRRNECDLRRTRSFHAVAAATACSPTMPQLSASPLAHARGSRAASFATIALAFCSRFPPSFAFSVPNSNSFFGAHRIVLTNKISRLFFCTSLQNRRCNERCIDAFDCAKNIERVPRRSLRQ